MENVHVVWINRLISYGLVDLLLFKFIKQYIINYYSSIFFQHNYNSIMYEVNLMKKIENRAGKPAGIEGEEMLDVMDSHHTPISLWAFDNLEINVHDLTLDIGCGSGLNVKRTYEKSYNAKSIGVDYSEISVKKSKETNNELIKKGFVEILKANVLDMPFEDNMFDVITAFETVYFWPDIIDAFKEVKRILKYGGKFSIILECNGHYSSHLDALVEKENCKFYNDEELRKLLFEAGFSSLEVIIRYRLENKKLIKYYDLSDFHEEMFEDFFELDVLNDDQLPLSPEWLCITSKK